MTSHVDEASLASESGSSELLRVNVDLRERTCCKHLPASNVALLTSLATSKVSCRSAKLELLKSGLDRATLERSKREGGLSPDLTAQFDSDLDVKVAHARLLPMERRFTSAALATPFPVDR